MPSNNSYPPKVDDIILIKKDNLELIGKVIMRIPDNGNRCLISLLNNKDYVDESLSRYNITNKGYLILSKEDTWAKYDENYDINTPKTIYDDKIKTPQTKKQLLENECEYYQDYNDKCDTSPKPIRTENVLSALKKNVPSNMIGIATSKLVTYDNPIMVRQDEIGEGSKIITWLGNKLGDLDIKMDMITHNGYVHIMRENCGYNSSIITEELLEGRTLRFFEWQIGKPIDYDILRNVLFKNNFQRSIKKDMDQLDEAKLLLSLEYLIGLQPNPEFQIWAVYRLIICWLSDQEMLDNVRKIKMLVNTYRARPDIKDNKARGILPSIVIYPKYGHESAKIVLERVNYFFTFFKNIAWINSNPTYFIKIDELVYYTNGLSDLKLYVRNVIKESNFSNENIVFDDKYTRIDLAENLFRVLE